MTALRSLCPVLLVAVLSLGSGCVCGPKMIDPCTGRVLNPLPRLAPLPLLGMTAFAGPLGTPFPCVPAQTFGCAMPPTIGCHAGLPAACAAPVGCAEPLGCAMPPACGFPTGCAEPVGCGMPVGRAAPALPDCGCGLTQTMAPMTRPLVASASTPPRAITRPSAAPPVPPAIRPAALRQPSVRPVAAIPTAADYGFDQF